MSIPQVGDIGTVISIDVGEDVSAASVAKIVARKPSGTIVQWTGSGSGDTVTYTIVDGDLDEAGPWRLQAYVELAAWSGYSEQADLTVGERLTDAS